MNVKDSKNILKIYLVKVDMRLLRHFADYILENGESNYLAISQNTKMALKVALIICYSRPFLENFEISIENEFPIFDFLIKDFHDEEKVLHNNILEMYLKEIGTTDIAIPSIEDIESNITHIALSKITNKPLEFKIIKTLRVMAKKIYTNAEELVEGTPKLDDGFSLRNVNTK
jgi:hypothetical protein